MSLGWSEVLMLLVFALVVFGPKRLPEMGRQIGRFIGEIRSVSREFEREVRDAVEPFADEVRHAEQIARRTYELDPDLSTFRTPPPTGE